MKVREGEQLPRTSEALESGFEEKDGGVVEEEAGLEEGGGGGLAGPSKYSMGRYQ